MEYEIKDGVRKLLVQGDLLASSTSEDKFKDRWVEFKLFKASVSGSYVISRVGHSRLFHGESCDVVSRNRLSAVSSEDLEGVYKACLKCEPNWADPNGIYPEIPRAHAQVCSTAHGVLDYLTKYDLAGSEYFTNVAKRLLEEASKTDRDIKNAYMTEVIS